MRLGRLLVLVSVLALKSNCLIGHAAELQLPEAPDADQWHIVSEQWLGVQVPSKKKGEEMAIGFIQHSVQADAKTDAKRYLVRQRMVRLDPATRQLAEVQELSLWKAGGTFVVGVHRQDGVVTRMAPAKEAGKLLLKTGATEKVLDCPNGPTPDPLALLFVHPMKADEERPLWLYNHQDGKVETGTIKHDGRYELGQGKDAEEADRLEIKAKVNMEFFYAVDKPVLLQGSIAQVNMVPYDQPAEIISLVYENDILTDLRDAAVAKAWKKKNDGWSNAMLGLELTQPKAWTHSPAEGGMQLILESKDKSCALIIQALWYGKDLSYIANKALARQREAQVANRHKKKSIKENKVTIGKTPVTELLLQRKASKSLVDVRARYWVHGEYLFCVQALTATDAPKADIKGALEAVKSMAHK